MEMSKKLHPVTLKSGSGVSFWCPGCNCHHSVPVTGDNCWDLSGTSDAPTLSPSLSTTSGHYTPGWKGPDCWCTYNATTTPKVPFECSKCHLLLTNGMLIYLSDTTHALKGKTIPLPEFPIYPEKEELE